MKKPKRASSKAPARKKTYTEPKLAIHGDIAERTAAKAGDKQDGSGKPATRLSGSPA